MFPKIDLEMAQLKMAREHLVLLPGLDGTGRLFDPLLAALPGSFAPKVVAYPPDKPLNYHQLIPYIREVIPWDAPYVLLAESFSGPLALEFAAVQWENLRGVVLCASFVTNPLHPLLRLLPPALAESWFRKPPPERLLRNYLLEEECSEQMLRDLAQAFLPKCWLIACRWSGTWTHARPCKGASAPSSTSTPRTINSSVTVA
jgi:pimeloyl-ACP methyl ester carboxylesterase